jgi:light-regulated signal transduction histidine kinase (bacteriophytochrome)
LNYSKLTTTGEPFKAVDLADLIREVLTDLEVRIHETGGIVQMRDLPALRADRSQMRQLFQNLIGNALKYHRNEVRPAVEVSATPCEDGFYEILVEDNGIGFDERHLQRIFRPFQRLHGKGEYEGTGMGLAICKRIVERHGGSIRARSTPGKGSVFIVSLPKSGAAPHRNERIANEGSG